MESRYGESAGGYYPRRRAYGESRGGESRGYSSSYSQASSQKNSQQQRTITDYTSTSNNISSSRNAQLREQLSQLKQEIILEKERQEAEFLLQQISEAQAELKSLKNRNGR